MVGDDVHVISRRFDRAVSDTLALHFENGLEDRPILRPAEGDERLYNGGTIIRIRLSEDLMKNNYRGETLSQICGRMFPSISVRLHVEDDSGSALLDSTKWKTEAAEDLLKRVAGREKLSKTIRGYCSLLMPIKSEDNNIIGRIGVLPGRRTYHRFSYGTLSSNGVMVSEMRLMGVLEGAILTADRKSGLVKVSRSSVDDWGIRQEAELSRMLSIEEEQSEASDILWSFGYKPQTLKICRMGSLWFNIFELAEYLKSVSEVFVIQDAAFENFATHHAGTQMLENVIAVDMGWAPIISSNGNSPEEIHLEDVPSNRTLEMLLLIELREKFQISGEVIERYKAYSEPRTNNRVFWPTLSHEGLIYRLTGC